MPGHYNMPIIPNRYPLDKNDKLGLAIGALLSGGIAAANSNRSMGENPLLRGFEGGLVGFGAGGKAINDSYSAMLDDYLKGEGMNFKNRQMTQEERQFQDTLGLNREKFAEEKRRHAEREPNLPTSVAEWEYGQNIQNPRQRSEFFNRVQPLKQQKPSADQEEILNTQLNKLMAQKANYTSNINFNQNSPTIKQYTEQLDKRINDIHTKLKSLNPSKYDTQNSKDATALEEMLKLLNQQ